MKNNWIANYDLVANIPTSWILGMLYFLFFVKSLSHHCCGICWVYWILWIVWMHNKGSEGLYISADGTTKNKQWTNPLSHACQGTPLSGRLDSWERWARIPQAFGVILVPWSNGRTYTTRTRWVDSAPCECPQDSWQRDNEPILQWLHPSQPHCFQGQQRLCTAGRWR